jgi:hypothetical protein
MSRGCTKLTLEELRASLGPDRLISVAGLPWRSSIEEKVTRVEGYRWSMAYYQSVASRVDQIVVMAYDSFAPSPALYRLWVREQVRGLLSNLASTKVDLLIGFSVSREITTSHNPDAENLSSGLAGLCAGLTAAAPATNRIKGIALYAEWEADAVDWQRWEQWQAGTVRYLN